MSDREPNLRLAVLLAEADWSAGELARAVNALGTAQGLRLRYDRSSVAHWLGGTRPNAPVPELIAAAFTQRLRRIVTPADTALAPFRDPTMLVTLTPPGGSGSVQRLIDLCHAAADPNRRAFLMRTAYTLTSVSTPDWLSPQPVEQPDQSSAGAAIPQDVAALEEVAAVFAVMRQRYGGGYIRSALTVYLADQASYRFYRPASAGLRRDLLTVVAQLTHILADMTADEMLPGLAQRYAHLALALAQEAGNRHQYAVSLRAAAAQALRLGHTLYALRLAEAAVEAGGPAADPSARAFLLTQRALAHAHDGRSRRALNDMTAAERHHSHATSPAGPFTAYPRAALEFQHAEVLLALGHHTHAGTHFQNSLQLRAPEQHRPLALTHARYAELLLQIGHLDAACAQWHSFLDHYTCLQSACAEQQLTRMKQHLRPHSRQRHAADVLARARALSDTT